MADLDKALKGLEHCGQPTECAGCPYATGMAGGCFTRLKMDALELLKEQEPVKPRYEDFFGDRVARCGNCNGYIVKYKYCPGCGRMVKWDV